MWDRSNYWFFLNNIIKNYNPDTKKILDVACWTWEVFKFLDKKYEKHWIDLSEEMLNIARNNFKDCYFYNQNMNNISLNIKFDFIYSIFDSINHLINYRDWELFFEKSFNLLNNDWVFVFDINTQYKLNLVWNYKPMICNDEKDIIIFSTYKEDSWITSWNIKFFKNVKENLFELNEERIDEISYPIEKIKKTLKKFKKIIIVDENNNPINETTQRAFFICIK